MALVMIVCPATGQNVSTGIRSGTGMQSFMRIPNALLAGSIMNALAGMSRSAMNPLPL